ncbi:MAG: nucleotidyltransferase domain-containing protein [Patescibacteria group bacterium]
MSILNQAQLVDALKRNQVAFAALFGSRAKGLANTASDYDFLIEFKPGIKYSLFDIVEVKDNLEQILNTKVDVITTGGLNPHLKDEVAASLQVLYDER